MKCLMELLQKNGVATRPGTHAVHMLNYYIDTYGFTADDFPNARDLDRQSMAIPLHNRMTQPDYDYVIDNLRNL